MKPRRIAHVMDILRPYVHGKRILDVGCIGHDLEFRRKNGTFYFEKFNEFASYCKGIDILDTAVTKAHELGFNVVKGNAETFRDDGGYDVIFAGELIEHLSNPGLFLDSCKENLNDTGVVVLTTPNTYSLARLVRVLFRLTNEPPVNPEHTFYYTPLTMKELVSRHGFTIQELYYSDYDYGEWPFRTAKRLGLKLNSMLCQLMPQFCQSFIVLLKPV